MKPLLAVLWCAGLLIAPAADVQGRESTVLESTKAEPGVAYGVLPGFSLPRTIVFSVGPDEIIADAQEWQRHGVSAFVLRLTDSQGRALKNVKFSLSPG